MKNITARQHFMLDCIFTVQKFKADGRITYQGKPFHNLILDCGLDLFFDHSMRKLMRYVNVGTDNTDPDVSQTGLLSFLASTDTLYDQTLSGQSEDPAHTSVIRVFEFDIGSCTGNLTEVGLSYESNNNYFNRQLFKDAVGDPTTITVLEDEGLRITAEMRVYSDLQTAETEPGSFDLDGSSIGYTREVNTEAFTDVSCSTYDACFPDRFRGENIIASVDDETTLETGGVPEGGNDGNSDEITVAGYTPGDFYADAEIVWKAGTYVGDINRVVMGYAGSGTYSKALSTFVLDSAITLSDTEQLTLNFRRSWGRYAS